MAKLPVSIVRPLSERTLAKPSSGNRKAKQAFKDEVDINSIVSRFTKSGVPIPAPTSKPTFYDMTTLPANLHDALSLRERLRTTISSFSPSLQSAYNANPREFLRSLDIHLTNLRKAEKVKADEAAKGPVKPVEPSKPAGGENTPPEA